MADALAGLSSAQARHEFEDLLNKISQAQKTLDEENEKLVAHGVTLHTMKADLEREKLGEDAFQNEIQKLKEELQYRESQITFYQDGVNAVTKLYDMCNESLAKVENEHAFKRLELSRTGGGSETLERRRQLVNDELLSVKSELAEVMKEWTAADSEMRLMMEKKRNKPNKYFGTIADDYHALREWRKFKYFSQMVETLKGQLRSTEAKFNNYRAERIYAAILRHRIPLDQWVQFTKEQLTRQGEDEGSVMELDAEAGEVHELLQFIAERGRAAESQTWPDIKL